jgi:hypothetical protein
MVFVGKIVLAWSQRRGLVASRGRRVPRRFGRKYDPARQEAGRRHLRERGVLVCGLIRNGSPVIEASLHALYSSVVPHAGRYKFLILENDSTDGTRDLLLAWHGRDPNLLVLGDGTYNAPACKLGLRSTANHDPEPWRIAKMAELRNRLLDEIERPAFDGYDYVLMVDLDLAGVLFPEGLLDTFGRFAADPGIDAIASLGIDLSPVLGAIRWHDPYALEDAATAGMTMHEKDAWVYARRGLEGHGLEPVVSAFNGACFYRRDSLRGRRYGTELVQGIEPLCEHVFLNRQMPRVHINHEFLYICFLNAHPGRTHRDLPPDIPSHPLASA